MRYLPHTPSEIAGMLETVGVKSFDELFDSIPKQCRTVRPLNIPQPFDEWQLRRHVERLAGLNATTQKYDSYLGAGCYEHHVPSVVTNLLGRSEFVTAYTPYQPEVSQGTLQAIYEYQTMVCRLLGMDVANASLYDGASALAEALLMAIRITGRNRVAVSKSVHPRYLEVAGTYLAPGGYGIVELPFGQDGNVDLSALENTGDIAAVAVQSPNVFGCIESLKEVAEKAHAVGALMIVVFTEPLAYGLLKNPGMFGADIVCGEGRSFGLGMNAGGMSLGMFASKREYVRQMPGRIIGMTADADDRRGFVLTLATREQHIRREKATSNICSNQSLCALGASMYLSCLGKTGIRSLAKTNYNKAAYLRDRLVQAGCSIPFSRPVFNEFVVKFPSKCPTAEWFIERNIMPGLFLENWYPELDGCCLVCVTETKSREQLDRFAEEVRTCTNR
jgi:glycine dehydrogenase subunit 1